MKLRNICLLSRCGAIQRVELLAHLRLETHTFYANEGGGLFSDRSRASGLAAPSLPFTGFGTAWFDFDNDVDTDVVFQNNGGPVRLLLNQIGHRQSWIGFRLVDPIKSKPESGPVRP